VIATLEVPRTATRRTVTRPPVDPQHILIEGASWAFYEQAVREFAGRPFRLTYDNGRLEVMSRMPEHERPKALLGRFIQMLTFERRMPMASFGSTTFRSKSKRRGLEPDECFYIQNESRVRRRRRIDLQRDPPPDLVVEIDITSPSIPREPIYAAMGVPELWRYDGRRLQCLHWAEGVHRVRQASIAFPFLKPSALGRFVNMLGRRDETAIAVAFMDWARKNGLLDR
jgi:Uma2 family endonuclease